METNTNKKIIFQIVEGEDPIINVENFNDAMDIFRAITDFACTATGEALRCFALMWAIERPHIDRYLVDQLEKDKESTNADSSECTEA